MCAGVPDHVPGDCGSPTLQTPIVVEWLMCAPPAYEFRHSMMTRRHAVSVPLPDTNGGLVLGTHIYPATGAAADRMRRALDAWVDLPGVRLINLQFADDPGQTHPGFDTRAVLRKDSRAVTGRNGPRKPTMREMLDRLVEIAEATNATYAGFSNADILLSPRAIARVTHGRRDAVIFSRMDIDPLTEQPLGEFFSGQDTLFIRPAAYRAVRSRLRHYVVGEMPWDVIYTSVLLSHCDAELVNRGDDCRHIVHETIWTTSPFAPYAWRLAHMDWTYYARWYRYYNAARELREAGRPAAEEDALRDRVFAPLTAAERGLNIYRRLRFGGLRGA